jgi:hypothetical protein
MAGLLANVAAANRSFARGLSPASDAPGVRTLFTVSGVVGVVGVLATSGVLSDPPASVSDALSSTPPVTPKMPESENILHK